MPRHADMIRVDSAYAISAITLRSFRLQDMSFHAMFDRALYFQRARHFDLTILLSPTHLRHAAMRYESVIFFVCLLMRYAFAYVFCRRRYVAEAALDAAAMLVRRHADVAARR